MTLSRPRLRLGALIGATAAALITTSLAAASFSSSQSAGPITISSATLAAPTAPSGTCNNYVDKICWTQTSSTFADGYDILRGITSGGSYPTNIPRGRTRNHELQQWNRRRQLDLLPRDPRHQNQLDEPQPPAKSVPDRHVASSNSERYPDLSNGEGTGTTLTVTFPLASADGAAA